MQKFNISISLIIFLIVCQSCAYDKKHTIGPELDCSTIIPDTISFKRDIIPIFNTNCNIVSCHSGSEPAGNFNLEESKAYTQLSKRGSGYIDTINPKRSVLYSSIVSVSNPMPPVGKLDDCTIALIAEWMKQKGKNN